MNDMHDDLRDDGISRLYQRSRIEEPPMGLDSAILSQGRKAVKKKKNLWCRVRWVVPLTSFALAMLTATLFIQMRQEHPEIVAPSSVVSPAPILPPTLQTGEGLKDDLQRDLKKRKATVGKEQREMGDAAATPAPAMELKSAPAEMETAPARNLMKQKQEAVGTSQFRSRESLSETDSAAPPQAKDMKGQTALTPDAWIEKIRGLLKQGKKDEAVKELKTFRTAYPDYELPADLK